MLNIFNFSMIYTFKKKSTWFLLALLGLVSFGIPYLITKGSVGDAAGSAPRLSALFSNPLLGVSFYIFYSVMLMSYLSVKSLNINKDGEENGSTLLLVSKRFTRGDIVFGRFFAVITHLFFAAFVVFLGLLLADTLLKGPSGFDYVLSLFVGTLIIGSVYVSFATLLSTTAGRVGTMFISIVVAFGIVLVNTILVPIGGGQQLYEGDFGSIANVTVGADGEVHRSVNSSSNDASIYEKEKYRTYSKIDIWYQLSSTLLLFTDEDVVLDKVDYETNSDVIAIRDSIGLPFGDDLQNQEHLYLSYPSTISYIEGSDSSSWVLYYDKLVDDIAANIEQDKVDKISNMANALIGNHTESGSNIPPTLYQVFDIVGELSYNFDQFNQDYDQILDGTNSFNALGPSEVYGINDYEYKGDYIEDMHSAFENVNISYDRAWNYNEVVEEYTPQLLAFEVLKNMSANATNWSDVVQPTISDTGMGNLQDFTGNPAHSVTFRWFAEKDFTSSYVISPYISKTARIVTWVLISTLMFIATLAIYYRRDFR